MQSSSDHARLPYSEASSEIFEQFDQRLFVSAKVTVTITTEDGAAELYLVDSTYALIAQGAGRIDIDLDPGQYQVRQRVGETERIHELRVVEAQPHSVCLPALDFTTPIPLPGSILARGAGLEQYVLEVLKGNFRLLLWTPLSDMPLPVDALWEARKALSVETFDGQPCVALTVETGAHSIWVTYDLEPGSYVLVQKLVTGRQRCLPVRIAEGLVTSVYLTLLVDEKGREIPLELQHGAVTLLSPSMRGGQLIGSLRRLEAARKALALGRSVSGWSTWDEVDSVMNPLLSLIDRHLARASATVDHEREDSQLEVWDIDSGSQPDENLKVPLLRRSWSRLLETSSTNAELLALFSFDFEVESSNSWFIWSEASGARTLRVATNPVDVVHASPGIWSVLAKLATAFTRLHKLGKQAAPDDAMSDRPSYDDLVQLLAGLVKNPMARKLLRKSYRALEDRVESEKDPALQRLFGALDSMTDKTLLKAMGAEELVRSALRSLELPEERRIEHAQSLFKLLQQQLSEEDRKVTAGLVGAAGRWLWGKDFKKQPGNSLDRLD